MAERLAPDAILVQTGLTGTVTDIQDDPDAPDGNWLTSSSNTATELRTSFPSPSKPLQTGAGLQEVRVLVRSTGQSTNPTCDVYVYESGTQIAQLVTAQSVSAAVVLSGTFDAALLTDKSGAGLEVRVVGTVGGGTPSKRAALEVGAVEINATVSTGQTFTKSFSGAIEPTGTVPTSKSSPVGADTGLDQVAQQTWVKPNRPLWYAHGKWWLIAEDAAGQWRIFRRDAQANWVAGTDTNLGATTTRRFDAWYDEPNDRVFITRTSDGSSDFDIFTYDAGTDDWTLASQIAGDWHTTFSNSSIERNGRIVLDTAGRVWVFQLNELGTLTYSVIDPSVPSITTPNTTLVTGLGSVNPDYDILDVVAFNDGDASIGVAYSKDPDSTHFIHHHDTDAVGTWQVDEVVDSSASFSDNHVSLAVDASGGITLVNKTTLAGAADVNIWSRSRAADGSAWSARTTLFTRYGGSTSEYTRPRIIFDAHGDLHMFVTRDLAEGVIHHVLYAGGDVSAATLDEVVISVAGTDLDNAGITAQPVPTSDSGVLVVCAINTGTSPTWEALSSVTANPTGPTISLSGAIAPAGGLARRTAKLFSGLFPSGGSGATPSLVGSPFVNTADGGGTASVASLVVPAVTARANTLYVVVVESRDTSGMQPMASVVGGGLSWSVVPGASATGGRAQDRQEVWVAYGSPAADFDVTITPSTAQLVLIGVVLLVADADPDTQVDAAAVATTAGVDDANPSVSVTSLTDGAFALGALLPRNRTVSAADANWTPIQNTTVGTSGNVINDYTSSRALGPAGSYSKSETLSNTADWVSAILVVRPGPSGSASIAGAVATALSSFPTIVLNGLIVPSGALIRSSTVHLVGSASSIGAVFKRAAHSFAGAIAPAATLRRMAGAVLGGTVDAAGQIARRSTARFAGTITSLGSIDNLIAIVLASAVQPTGQLARGVRKRLAGSAHPTGVVAKTKTRLLALVGSIRPSGLMVRRTLKSLSAALDTSGALARSIRVRFVGSVASSGAAGMVKAILRSFGGTVNSAGSLARSSHLRLAGTVETAGSLVRFVRSGLAGSLTPHGLATVIRPGREKLLSVAGSIAPAGQLIRSASLGLSGSVDAAGSLIRSVGLRLAGAIASAGTALVFRPGQHFVRAFSGSITSAGSVRRRVSARLTGSLPSAGTLVRTTARTLSGVVAQSGSLRASQVILRAFAGSIDAAGSLLRAPGLLMAGSVAANGALMRRLALVRAFAGTVGSSGSLVRAVSIRLAGVVTSAGEGLVNLGSRFRLTFTGSITPHGAYRLNKLRQVLLSVPRGRSTTARSRGSTSDRPTPPTVTRSE